jgi:hypothetical protein
MFQIGPNSLNAVRPLKTLNNQTNNFSERTQSMTQRQKQQPNELSAAANSF